ncbi:MAG: 4-hydroxy-tetrahydrodipicolinate reductase [Bacteroidota bacterium]
MRIALLGYGKMGHAIEKEALKRGHEISARIDLNNRQDLSQLQPQKTDIVIEFTHPESFLENIDAVLSLGLPMVSGTTGWYDRMDQVRQFVERKQASFLFSANFSIGVNILSKLNRQLAQLMNQYPEYDCFLEERHHRWKADGPSGTAHALAAEIVEHLDRKKQVASVELTNRPPEPEELSVGFVRSGDIVGEHTVCYSSEIDSITISHQARNRRGFALGAVIAAEWLKNRTGFYEFKDLF